MKVDQEVTRTDVISSLEMAFALTNLLASAPIRLALFDSKMRYLASSRLWNESYLVGVSEIMGKSHYDLMPLQPAHWRKFHQMGLKGHATARKFDKWLDSDGNANYINWSVTPWLESDGSIGGLIILTEDVTDQWLAHEAVQESQERYELAVKATNNGIYDWNLMHGQMYWSPVFCEMLGLPGHFDASQEFWRSLVDKKDLDRISDELQRVAKDPDIEFYTTRYRIRHADGHMVPILARSVLKRDHNGRVVRLVGANVDLSKICVGPTDAVGPIGDSGPRVVDLLQEATCLAADLDSRNPTQENDRLLAKLNKSLQLLTTVFKGTV